MGRLEKIASEMPPGVASKDEGDLQEEERREDRLTIERPICSECLQHEKQRILEGKVDLPPVEVFDVELGNMYQLPTLLETFVKSIDGEEGKKQASSEDKLLK